MTFNSIKVYQILFALSILSILNNMQFLYGIRILDILILITITFAIFFIKIDRRNFKILLVGSLALAIALVNDGFYLSLNVWEEGRVLSRVILYEKYMLFFTIPVIFSIIQRKKYFHDYKYLISNALLILYLVIVPLLLYQSLTSNLPRLSFPFSNDLVMGRSDGHALSIAMVFLLVNTFIFLERKSILLRLLVITPGFLVLLLTGSRGGILVLIAFCLLYFKFRWFIFISLLFLIIISLVYFLNIEIYSSESITRVFDIETMISANFTSEGLNRWSMNPYIFSELLENFKIFTGMGLIGMRFFYYDALLPSLFAPFGMLGFLLVFYFLFSLYRMNIPNSLNNKRIYNIFSIMFLISIGISEYHLVTRVYVIMIACIYCCTDNVNYKKTYSN